MNLFHFFCFINRFLNKKRNSGRGDTIIPWRVSSNGDDNYKTNVPINATLIGSGSTIVVTLSVILRSQFSESTTILVLFSMVASMFQIPLVLAFTIKHHNKTSNINPVVPKTLQFHDDGSNCDDDIINFNEVITFNEVNNEVTGNQEHPKTTVVEVYNSGENIDKDDENVDDTCEHLKLAISSKQIIEGTSQLPGQV
jgi:hypothetical protein